MARGRKKTGPKSVETLTHDEAARHNIPTAEYHPVLSEEDMAPVRVAWERRNRDLDPQLVWRGKDAQDAADLVVQAPPLYIQEKVHPKALIDDLLRQTKAHRDEEADAAPDLFADFNGLPDEDARTEFYRHDANWSNRMILGDSLQVMASLAEREGLRGKVQCIYIDPPYGIRFNSNFQWSTTSRDVKDGKAEHITREPEQVKAFRDTWRDGIHSYLSYLRDRLTVARELLTESGSVFVQIGDENVHRVRVLMDEIFGDRNCVCVINYRTSAPLGSKFVSGVTDTILWFAKDIEVAKFRRLFYPTEDSDMIFYGNSNSESSEENSGRPFANITLVAAGPNESCVYPIFYQGRQFNPTGGRGWKTTEDKMQRVAKADRFFSTGRVLRLKVYWNDFPYKQYTNIWMDLGGASNKRYVVQTSERVVQRCILMTTDPGDLVLDPTCGSGTAAYVAEQWGRRWITIDTSRVALALARARIMGARYPWYLLADSPEGRRKEAETARRSSSAPPTETPTGGDIRWGFVYERVPHITLKSIANNAEIDVIWEKWQQSLEPLRARLNAALDRQWEEWEIPRTAGEGWPGAAAAAHATWWEGRIARQKEIDAAIVARAEHEYLYDNPYVDKSASASPAPSPSRAWRRTGCWRWTRMTTLSPGCSTGRSATARRRTSPT